MHRFQRQPRFVGVGYQKCGSTSLFELAAAGTGARSPERPSAGNKELHGIPAFMRPTSADRRRYIRRLGASPRAEFTPNYAYFPSKLVTLDSWFPGVKFLFTVRNPIDRFYSSLDHGKGAGVVPLKTTDVEAFEASYFGRGSTWLSSLLPYGRYLPGIRAGVATVGADRVYLTSLEVLSDPKSFKDEVSRLADFLETPAENFPTKMGRSNQFNGLGTARAKLPHKTPRSDSVVDRLTSYYSEWFDLDAPHRIESYL